MTEHQSNDTRARLTAPGLSAGDVLRSLEAELSMKARLATTVMMLFALAVTAVVASLWLTEPYLPVRTQVGFALIVIVGLCWSGHFARVLVRRRIPYARHRVAAGTLAVVFSSIFVIAALALAYLVPERSRAGLGAAAFGLPMVVVAAAMLIRARRRYRALLERRRELQRGDE